MAAPKGNRNAAKAKEWEAALRHELDNFQSSSIQRGLALRAIAKKVVEKAVEGEWRAIDEIGNRIDGKPRESVEHSGSIENRHVTELSREQLLAIATGSSEGTAAERGREPEPPGVH